MLVGLLDPIWGVTVLIGGVVAFAVLQGSDGSTRNVRGNSRFTLTPTTLEFRGPPQWDLAGPLDQVHVEVVEWPEVAILIRIGVETVEVGAGFNVPAEVRALVCEIQAAIAKFKATQEHLEEDADPVERARVETMLGQAESE
jgi:hypothetical protein